MNTLDAVVPVYNEIEILPELHRRLTGVLEGLPLEWRVIYVNDGSVDGSTARLDAYADADPRVVIVHLARNFGQQAAIAAGLSQTDADAVILLDGDLQDPPEVIPELLETWKAGHDVVYAVKRKRKEALPKRALFSLFYLILGKLSSLEIPANAGNFSLMDRRVVETINAMPEHNRYVSGLRAYVGGSQTGVEFEREARYAGQPRQSPLKLFRMAVDAFVSYSEVPLRLATVMGFVVSGMAFLVLLNVLWQKLVSGEAILGWASVMTSVLFIGGIQLIAIGMIGEYIGRIYTETKHRPNWIVDRSRNLDSEPTAARAGRATGVKEVAPPG
ncbi:MAG: glycosyltransferase family 2 protein [marine benthic group bacterium]|nr:glycosyltransferase family 2 protein [Candidatus Carthagonibacter metallireducens]MCL7975222.1 glycosyltransferase family 2 protein [Gemmatimonadota bacterium]